MISSVRYDYEWPPLPHRKTKNTDEEKFLLFSICVLSPCTYVARVKSRRRRHMWVEFIVGFLPCTERFFSGYSGFPVSSKTNISKFQFDQEKNHYVDVLPLNRCLFSYIFEFILLCTANNDHFSHGWILEKIPQRHFLLSYFLAHKKNIFLALQGGDHYRPENPNFHIGHMIQPRGK